MRLTRDPSITAYKGWDNGHEVTQFERPATRPFRFFQHTATGAAQKMPLVKTNIPKIIDDIWPGFESTEGGRTFISLLQRLISWDPNNRRIPHGAFIDRSARVPPGLETPPPMEGRTSPPHAGQGSPSSTRALCSSEFYLDF